MNFLAPLFDLAEGRARRDAAIATVEEHASDDWTARALEAVYQVASRHLYFAADTIWEAGLEKPREPRAMGPVMMKAVRLGYCEPTGGWRQTRNVSQHAQPIRTYHSRIFNPEIVLAKKEAAVSDTTAQ